LQNQISAIIEIKIYEIEEAIAPPYKPQRGIRVKYNIVEIINP